MIARPTRHRQAADRPPLFDHLMHWVPDLPAAAASYRAAGLPVSLNKPRPGTGLQNGGWWKELHYIELLAVVDFDQARASTTYGQFTPMILRSVESTLAGGGGALNFALVVSDVTAAVTAWRNAGLVADQHTVRIPVGPARIAAYTLGWLNDAPPWAPFLIRHHPALRRLQQVALPLMRRRQTRFDLHRLIIEVPDPTEQSLWLARRFGLNQHSRRPATVDLGGCMASFVRGPADRTTTIELTGPQPPEVVIAGLGYRPAASADSGRAS